MKNLETKKAAVNLNKKFQDFSKFTAEISNSEAENVSGGFTLSNFEFPQIQIPDINIPQIDISTIGNGSSSYQRSTVTINGRVIRDTEIVNGVTVRDINTSTNIGGGRTRIRR